MIASDRPLVYRWHTNRLTWASLGCYLIRRRCSRQRKLANPVKRKGRLNVKYFHIRQLSLAGFAVFVTVFFSFITNTVFCYLPQKSPRATFCYFCSHFALPLLEKITGLQARFSQSLSFCQLAMVAPPQKQLETPTSEPARRLVYRSSGDSRYLVIH